MKYPSPQTLRISAGLAGILPFAVGCDPGADTPRPAAAPSPDTSANPSPSPADNGTATEPLGGKVTFMGTPPPARTIGMDAVCGKLHATAVTVNDYAIGQGNGLANVFVYIKEGLTGTYAPPEQKPLLDQVGCLYNPSILTVWAGQPFDIRNSDALLHNVHALPKRNPEFNFGQVIKGQVTTKTFDQPEPLIRVKCDVHPWMMAHVNVVDHPFHDLTDQDGNFTLPSDLPPGTYTIEAVHPKAGAVTQRLTFPLPPSESITLTLQAE